MNGLADNPDRKLELLGELASDPSLYEITPALSNYVRHLGVNPTRMCSPGPSTLGRPGGGGGGGHSGNMDTGTGTGVSSTGVNASVGVGDAPMK